MKVKIEDLETNQIREKEFPLPNLRQLRDALIEISRQNKLGFHILLKGRGKFIEIWSSDGKKLMERYTRTDK